MTPRRARAAHAGRPARSRAAAARATRVRRSATVTIGALVAAAWLVCVLVGPAWAQATGAPAQRPRGFVITVPPANRPGVEPLGPNEMLRLSRARSLWMTGKRAAARDTLVQLLAAKPHHPVILAELAQVYRVQGEWRAIEQLARAERSSRRDSLLLADDYAEALQRLGRPREAAQALIEAWIAAPEMSTQEWASLQRLAEASPREVQQALKPAVASYPANAELARLLAQLQWRAGDTRAALQTLAAADHGRDGTPVRWSFAEEALARATREDSAAAAEVFLDLAGDTHLDPAFRLPSARRAWNVLRRREPASAVTRVARALQDVPAERWGDDLVIGISRALREAGLTAEARALLGRAGDGSGNPDLALERALDDLRERADDRALEALHALAAGSPESGFRYAEALLFAGQVDSAAAWYRRVSTDPREPTTGAALERLFLIEDGEPREALPAVGRLAYEEWRGDARRAAEIADSLMRTLPHGTLWAHAALALARVRESLGDGQAALAPLLAVADSLPDERLAPLARQRAGDVLRIWYKDDARALAQYEECLARYPRAWNAPEVRRLVENMRRTRRF